MDRPSKRKKRAFDEQNDVTAAVILETPVRDGHDAEQMLAARGRTGKLGAYRRPFLAARGKPNESLMTTTAHSGFDIDALLTDLARRVEENQESSSRQ